MALSLSLTLSLCHSLTLSLSLWMWQGDDACGPGVTGAGAGNPRADCAQCIDCGGGRRVRSLSLCIRARSVLGVFHGHVAARQLL
jgi:hypothetical protein